MYMGCGGDSKNPTTTTTTTTTTSLTIAPSRPTIAVGATQQFNAICTPSPCPTLTWTSSAPSVATIGERGIATGVAVGTTTIKVRAGGLSASATLTVTSLSSIAVTPTSKTITVNESQTFTANCYDATTPTAIQITCPTLTWYSSMTSVATINTGGLATGIKIGTTNITARWNTISSTPATLIVNGSVPTTTKKIFITTATRNGNMGGGGIESADALCASEAAAANLRGTYKALLLSSTRYPCNEAGNCSAGASSDWPVAANTNYSNASDTSNAVILTSNANMVFESSYSIKSSIKTAEGDNESSLFWTGISGVSISGKTSPASPAAMDKWSYANESANWGPEENWDSYTTLNCGNWTYPHSAYATVGDNGMYPDTAYARTLDVIVGEGYASNNLSNLFEDLSEAPSRWLAKPTTGSGNRSLYGCSQQAHLICVEE